MINTITKINNFLRAASYFDANRNFVFADKLQIEATNLFKKSDIQEIDEYNLNIEIGSQTIINWMLKNQDVFGPPHEKKIYADGYEVGQPRPVVRTEPSYYEHTLKRAIDDSGWYNYRTNSTVEHIIQLYPNISVHEMNYLSKLSQSEYFREHPLTSPEVIKEALGILDKHQLNNYEEYFVEFAKSVYLKNKKYRDIPIEIVKEIFEAYYGTSPHMLMDLTKKHLNNYVYYGDAWRKPAKINIPENILNNKTIDDYKAAYNFAISHEDQWGQDFGGIGVASFVENITQEDLNKTDAWKIAKSFFGVNNGKWELDEKLNKLQNDIDKIYRFPPNTPENDRLLIFFSKYKGTVGIPLSVVNSIESKNINTSPGGNEMYFDLPRILNVFGKSWEQWLRKFDGDIHKAAQILPPGNTRELNGLGLFLLQYYGKYNTTILNLISSGWKKLSPEERKMPPGLLERMVFERKAKELLSTQKIENMDFAMEAGKWWEYDSYNVDIEEEIEEEIEYKTLEKLYIDSQNVPLPKWAENNTTTIGNLTGRFLPRSDPRGMFLGMYSNSCQHPWNVGADCAYHGQASPHGAFFVVENNKTQEIIAQSWVWEDNDGDVVFDNVEANGIGPVIMPVVNQIYKQVADNMKGRLVHIGEGGTDLDIKHLPKSRNPIKLPENLYSDAKQQRILADNTGVNT